MRKLTKLDFLNKEMNKVMEDLQNELKFLPSLVIAPLEPKSEPKDPKNDKGEPILTTTPILIMELIPFQTFASLLIEIGAQVEIIVKAIEELGTIAKFKTTTNDKPEQN